MAADRRPRHALLGLLSRSLARSASGLALLGMLAASPLIAETVKEKSQPGPVAEAKPPQPPASEDRKPAEVKAETKAPDAKAPEVKAPETKPPDAKVETPPEAPSEKPIVSPPQTEPKKVDTPEARYIARLDAAIAPTREYTPSVEDATRLRDAFKAIAAGNLAKARELRNETTDRVAKLLIEWQELRASGPSAGIEAFKGFHERNPTWPSADLFRTRIEEAVFIAGGNAEEIRKRFAKDEPRSAAGRAALAAAFLAEKNEAKAKELAVAIWREGDIGQHLEAGFVERFGSLLTPADHKWRFDRLISEGARWKAERAAKVPQLRRMIPLLAEGERKKAEARIAVFLRQKNAAKLMAGFKVEGEDWGFLQQRIQSLRLAKKYEEARKLVLTVPADPAKVAGLDGWWIERRAHAYEALRAGEPKAAYEMVKDAGVLSDKLKGEAHGFAGWIALRLLKDAKTAEAHFAAARPAVTTPITSARIDYWHGRALEGLGQKERARERYTAAARHIHTFHGQLAREVVSPSDDTIRIVPPAEPTADEVTRFNGNDAVKAVIVARKADLPRAVTRTLLTHLRVSLQSEGEQAMVTHLAQAVDDIAWSVRLAKLATIRGHNLVYYGYPVHPFPDFTPLRALPEKAFLLAITRQESEFGTDVVSGAGARGLMQVMPITARHVCKDHKVKCELPRLLSDPAYNATIASAYIGDRMAEFAGSYVLGIAGYNAGPGRARQWIREFGDPRAKDIDPIDWIERIPFEETREYVGRVLSNIQMYRARLGDETNALQLAADLMRARGETRTPADAPSEPDDKEKDDADPPAKE